MATSILAAALAGTVGLLLMVHVSRRKSLRAEFIRSYSFPIGLFEKVRKKHPHLTLKDCQLVSRALRQFFLTHLKSGCKFVSMPSQVTDDLWHEFILYTKHYDAFCKQAFGRFMHHSPAVVLGSIKESNAGLRRCWWYACQEENIDPKKPLRLPLLFAIDNKLDIKGGFRYATDCRGVSSAQYKNADSGNAVMYCGGDFSSPSIDGSTDGFGDSLFGDSGVSGDSGGGGCGGGCGGGD